jgi:hypothetical protein
MLRTAGTVVCRETFFGAAVLAAAFVSTPATVDACPDCQLSRGVRARVTREAFWENLLIAAAPMGVVATAAAMLHGVGRRGTR